MSRFRSMVLLGVVSLFTTVSRGAEPGLVAHYDFNEGSGTVLHDVSGNGNDGQIHGAQYVKRGKGYCLEFNGVDSYVDCGHKPSLDLRDAVTLEAWVYPDSRVQGEPGIFGKHFDSYLLTFYTDGKCYWYIDEGANNAKTLLTSGSWHHVVGTFDGTTMNLYLDGKLADTNTSKHPKINPGRNFLIGCVIGDPKASDPAYSHTTFFPGMIDEVKVYNRAQTETEVQAHFQTGQKELDLAAFYEKVKPYETLRKKGVTVKAGQQGQLEINTGKGSYLVESAFSYPGATIGWNHLSGLERGSEPPWTPRVKRGPSGDSIEITAKGKFYSLIRKISIGNGQVKFEDRLTSLSDQPTGLIVRNQLTAPQPFKETFAPGGAENPTLFLAGDRDALGLVAEDDISRLRFEPGLGLPANQVKFRVSNFALDARKNYTMRWTVYLLDEGATYFDLVNQVRRDWKTNFTIEGPFSFFDLGSPLLDRPVELKAYLQRKHLRIAALTPFLDYDPGSFDRVWSRQEFKERAQKAIRALKQADPSIKCVGSIETDWVAIDPSKIKGGEKLPTARPGYSGNPRLTPEQTKILHDSDLPWKGSVKRDANGNLTLELYMRGGKPQMSLSVYPAIGNHQYEFLMGQVKFLLEEVGTDGFYIDEFSQGWGGGTPTYGDWDGMSVEIDSRTGQIRKKYVDCSLAGITARVNLIDYAVKRGKIVVANTYSTSMEEQALPVNRFSETWGSFDPMNTPDGEEPPAIADLFRGNLATPIGLGIMGKPDKKDTARRVMKAVITYLRHGAVYYHYAIEDIPVTGPGSGEYGPVNHLLPITPIALHEGWIEGKERIVTALSGDYQWKRPLKPEAHRFDLNGREVPAEVKVSRTIEGWKVDVRIEDWGELVVIE